MNLLTAPVAEIISDGTPVELGLVITLIVAVGGLVGQWTLARHQIAELVKAREKQEAANAKAFDELRETDAEQRRELQKLQRQVDRQGATQHQTATKSGVWTPVLGDEK